MAAPCVLGMWAVISLHAIVYLRNFLTLPDYFVILFLSLTGPFVNLFITPTLQAFFLGIFPSIILFPVVSAYSLKPGSRTALISRIGICIWIAIGYFWLALITFIGLGECIYKISC